MHPGTHIALLRDALGVSGQSGQSVGRPSIISKTPTSICESSLEECKCFRNNDYDVSEPFSSLFFFSQRYLLNLN